MTRPLRLEFPGALWHVTNRGVEKRNIYLDDKDRTHFLHLLREVVTFYEWRLVAYVLMSNHYHLLFFTPDTNLSLGMKCLDGDYASWFNARYGRVGHLFQGRFGSKLVDDDTYLLEVARYVVLNPVRAGIVDTAGDWPWSSYRASAGLASVPSWLDLAPIFDRLDRENWSNAMTNYRELVATAVGQKASPWEHLAAQAFLGGPEFLRKIEELLHERSLSKEYLFDQRVFRRATVESIGAEIEGMRQEGSLPPSPSADARALLVLLCRRQSNATYAQIGCHLGITGQHVGRLAKIAEARLKNDPSFASLVQSLENRIHACAITSPTLAMAPRD